MHKHRFYGVRALLSLCNAVVVLELFSLSATQLWCWSSSLSLQRSCGVGALLFLCNAVVVLEFFSFSATLFYRISNLDGSTRDSDTHFYRQDRHSGSILRPSVRQFSSFFLHRSLVPAINPVNPVGRLLLLVSATPQIQEVLEIIITLYDANSYSAHACYAF